MDIIFCLKQATVKRIVSGRELDFLCKNLEKFYTPDKQELYMKSATKIKTGNYISLWLHRTLWLLYMSDTVQNIHCINPKVIEKEM